MARVAVTISLSDDERAELEALSRRRKTSQGLARRARIVLAAAEGLENKEIAVSSRGERGHRGASGVAAMRRRASTVCTTNPAPARRVKSAMTPSRKRSG